MTEGRPPMPVRERLELWSAILLAVATVATAYSAYQATRWGGVQATAFTEAGANRTESAKARSDGFALVSIDANIFTQYATAFTQDNRRLQKILEDHFFRDEFKPAFEDWIAQHPLTNPKADKNPFQNKKYRVADLERADELEQRASELFDQGKEANQTSDDYVLATIFFAGVLFFAGLASKFTSVRVATGAMAFGSLVLIGGLARLLTLPFH